MDNDYRQLVLKAEKMISSFQIEKEQVYKEGRNRQWEHDQVQSLKDKYKSQVSQVTNEMLLRSLQATAEAGKKAEQARKKTGRVDPKDGAEKLYHHNRVMALLGDLKDERAIDEFDYLASSLDEHEKKYHFIYEDVLRSRVRDPIYQVGLENVLNKHKSPEERAALRDAKLAEIMREHDKMLRGIIEQDVEGIASEGNRSPMPYVDLLDDCIKNANEQI